MKEKNMERDVPTAYFCYLLLKKIVKINKLEISMWIRYSSLAD
jgi:hypothetical protein